MSAIRIELAKKVFRENPEMCRVDRRETVLNGIIELGMTPFEAKLAGGEFNFKVIVDPRVWESTVDPIRVMWIQSLKPDESQIWMMFRNTTQYQSQGQQAFRVYFTKGSARSIEKILE